MAMLSDGGGGSNADFVPLNSLEGIHEHQMEASIHTPVC